jgi:hypothetical protein
MTQLFVKLNKILFDNKIKLVEKPVLLKKLLPRVTISFFNCILTDNPHTIPDNTLLHEMSHFIERCDYEKYKFKPSIFKTIKFYVCYLFPQVLSILSLLAFYNLWFLLFLLFLIPNPYLSTYRKNVELRGYFWDWYMKLDYDFPQIFNGWLYFKMDTKHDGIFYDDTFRKIFDKMHFSTKSSTYFKMFVLLREYFKVR